MDHQFISTMMNRSEILHWKRHPRIVSTIIRHSTPRTLRALRRTSKTLHDAVDSTVQSMYRIWGHRPEHPRYRRKTFFLLASLSSLELMIIEEYTGRTDPARRPHIWRSPMLSFADLSFATARPHVYFLFPRLSVYADFDPTWLYTRAPLAELVRFVAVSSDKANGVGETMWAFVGPEEWNEKLVVVDDYDMPFYDHFLDAIVRRRDKMTINQDVDTYQRKELEAVCSGTTRESWKEWTRPELVNFIEATQMALLAPKIVVTEPHFG